MPRENEASLVAASMVWTLEECVLTGLLLPFFTHFYIPILQPVQNALFLSASEDMSVVGQMISAGIWLITSIVILRKYRSLLSGARSVPWAVVFVGFTLLSAFWSQEPGVTVRKAVFLLLTTALGIYFASRYSVERQLRMICVAACIVACLSIGLALLLPRYGLDHDAHEGVWTGVFTQKNVCAREMLFALACVLPYSPASRQMRLIRRAAIVAVLMVTAGTQSKTALVLVAMMILFFPAMRLIRKLSTRLLFIVSTMAIMLSALLCGIVLSAGPSLVGMLGRDSTMTGRTEIWRAVLEAIFKRPFLGYGFAAFWLSLRGESANIVLALRWAVPAAHNGFLEVWLQLGGVGLLLFSMSFLGASIASIRCSRRLSLQQATWPLAILLLTLVYNLDESSLMQPNDFLWVLYIATLVNVAHAAATPKGNASLQMHQPLAV